jgi:hypothetical protein
MAEKITKISELIVPKEIKKDINPLSGYLNTKSPYYQKNPKGLFESPINIQYLQTETVSMLTFETYVSSVLENSDEVYSGQKIYLDNLIGGFGRYDYRVYTMVQSRVFSTKQPYPEESLIKNPVMQLHFLNRDFILDLSKNIILCPQTVIANFYDTDPLTGTKDKPEWDYGSASYSDGTWHPEHLFTQSSRNDHEGYWSSNDVTFDTDPPGQPFHPRENHYSLPNRTSRMLYSGSPKFGEVGSPGPGPGNKYKYDSYVKEGFKTSNGLFPRWQHPAQGMKLYQTNIDEALSGGGREDRRTQTNRGYNMSHLIEKSSY